MTAPGELTTGDGPRPVRVDLAPDESAPGEARRVARQALAGWHLPGLVDAVVLAVSELVTNAVRHGRPPLAVELRRRPRQVQLAVHDANPTEPSGVHDDAAWHAESGRGLNIVETLADNVRLEQVPDDGKIIHALFDAPLADPTLDRP